MDLKFRYVLNEDIIKDILWAYLNKVYFRKEEKQNFLQKNQWILSEFKVLMCTNKERISLI